MASRNTDMVAFGAAISAGKKGKTHRGAHHSEETKRVMSEKARERMSDPTRNPFIGKKRTIESREKQSRTRSERITNGDYGGWFSKGIILTQKAGEISFKSSWERNVALKFDADHSVKGFAYEPFSIPYYYHQVQRYYIPDFLVERMDGKKLLIEVKPKCFLDAAINVAKFAAASEYCEKNGLEFQVWTQEQLEASS